MSGGEVWEVALVAVTALHAGFQLTVTGLVYPALADLPAARWRAGHDAHSRRITPLVAVVYLALVVASVGALVTHRDVPILLAVLAVAASFGITAVRAAPLHARLGAGHDARLVRQLLHADTGRTACAVLALVAALVALLG